MSDERKSLNLPTENLQGDVRRTLSSVFVVNLSKLVLATTVLSMVATPFLVPSSTLWLSLGVTCAFALVYCTSWYLAIKGRVSLAAWVFVAGTLMGQIGALTMNSNLSEQALVSSVNLIFSAGFMLGRRAALVVSAVCLLVVLSFAVAIGMDLLPEPMVVVTNPMRIMAIVSTLIATAGLTYLGIQYMVETIEQVRHSEARTVEAISAFQEAKGTEERRTEHAERMGMLARNLVGLKEPAAITQEVVIGLRSALGADVVLAVARTGRIIADAGLGDTKHLDTEISGGWEHVVSSGTTRSISLEYLKELTGGLERDELRFGIASRGQHTPILLLVASSTEWVDIQEANWALQAATNLLEVALLRHGSERRMVQAQKMDALHRLSAGIAHDFNNLLTTILGGAELVEYRAAPDDPIQGHLRRIREAGERAAALTAKLMSFTRTAPRAPKVMDVGLLITDLLPVIRRTVEESIHLGHSIEDGTGLWVDGDPLDLERIILNLVANGREAVGQSGQLDIGVEIRSQGDGMPDNVVLWVQDDGEGMEMDVQSRMFEPFFTTRKGKGATGLGMSIVYGVVQSLGGNVFVDSRPGHGTCVEVHLPLADEPMTQPASPELVPLADVHGICVLVVEDAPDVRETLREMLEIGGYTVEAVGSGLEALERLVCEPPVDLVLSDVIMPKMGGFELAECMIEQGIAIPMALVSGYAARPGVDAPGVLLPRITKPFSLAELLAFVQEQVLMSGLVAQGKHDVGGSGEDGTDQGA
jgi:signal transduction histidine kinase/CheY-like chemotaxis protein